jgi:hypothetical protein
VDLLAAGAGNVFDQVVALVVDAQGGVVDFDGDDLTGITQSDLDALAEGIRGRQCYPSFGAGVSPINRSQTSHPIAVWSQLMLDSEDVRRRSGWV